MDFSAYQELLLVRMMLVVMGILGARSQIFSLSAFDGEDDVKLLCGSSPSSWTFNGSSLETVSGITYVYENADKSTVILNNVNHNAQGTYECLDSGGATLTGHNLKIVARPSFAECDPTATNDGSSCHLLPINAFTSSNVCFNASITYSNATTKPFIDVIEIYDSEGDPLARCTNGNPCSFMNAFAGRAQRIDGVDHTVLDTLLIAVQDVSANDTGSYSLTIKYVKKKKSTTVQTYVGSVDVNVTLANPGLASSSLSTPSSHIMPSSSSLVTIVSSSFPITPSPASTTTTTTTATTTTTTSQPRPSSSLQPEESNTKRSAVPSEAPPIGSWEIFAGAIVGTFIFAVIVCLIVVTTVVVSRQRIKNSKKSDSESSSSSELPSSPTTTTEEESSDSLPDPTPNSQTEQNSKSSTSTSQVQTTKVSSHTRHIIISESFHSFSFVDSTPPEPREGYPKLSDDRNSTKTCV